MGRKYLWWVKVAQKGHREKSKESIAAYQRQYYLNHLEERRAYMREYSRKRKESWNICPSNTKEYRHEYYMNNKKKFNKPSFERWIKDIQEAHNALIDKCNELEKQLYEKTKELEQLKKERSMNDEWKNKIKKFFNI